MALLGIKFGSSKATVMAAVKAKGGVYDKNNTTEEYLAFDNVKLGHRTAPAFLVKFVNNKAYMAVYVFSPDVEAKVIADYRDLVNDITGYYGIGAETKNYTYPYAPNDDNTLLGLSAGKIDFHTIWYDNNKNSIKVNITTDMVVHLTYQSDKLMNEFIDRQKAKEKGDF